MYDIFLKKEVSLCICYIYNCCVVFGEKWVYNIVSYWPNHSGYVRDVVIYITAWYITLCRLGEEWLWEWPSLGRPISLCSWRCYIHNSVIPEFFWSMIFFLRWRKVYAFVIYITSCRHGMKWVYNMDSYWPNHSGYVCDVVIYITEWLCVFLRHWRHLNKQG